jgi:hypothetical protein
VRTASAITGGLKDSIPEGCHLHTSFILAGISLDFRKLLYLDLSTGRL